MSSSSLLIAPEVHRGNLAEIPSVALMALFGNGVLDLMSGSWGSHPADKFTERSIDSDPVNLFASSAAAGMTTRSLFNIGRVHQWGRSAVIER
ncbi:MAG TPA: hypothetical protein VMW69_14125, partial [Spirochaetia bacterium]|nr:hypothetical protein [Spirochaetia bacterium]